MRKSILILALFLCAAHTYAQRIRVLSYNIHHAAPPSASGKIDLDAIAAVIKESNADLVGLQEVDVRVSRSMNVDQAQKLGELTGMHYFFAKGIDLEQGEYGTLILSKHKIVAKHWYELPMLKSSEGRALGVIDVEFPDGDIIAFANTHLDLYEENRIAQAAFINALAKESKKPMILVGDLNATPESAVIKQFEQQFVRNKDTNGPTFPNVDANTEIDYIMLSKKTKFSWKAYNIIPEDYASDHLPLFAEIEIKK